MRGENADIEFKMRHVPPYTFDPISPNISHLSTLLPYHHFQKKNFTKFAILLNVVEFMSIVKEKISNKIFMHPRAQ